MSISAGRMIRRDISRSEKFAELSKEAMVLFTLLIPHFNSWGKLNGSPHFIKGEICPLIPFLDIKTIEKCLREITAKTNVKWFRSGKLDYIHAIKFEEHQELRPERRGEDKFPDYKEDNSTPGIVQDNSGSTPGVVRAQGKRESQVQSQSQGQAQDHSVGVCHGEFLKFWKEYPRKTGKTEAEKSFCKISPDPALLQLMLKTIAWQKTTADWTREDGRYVPHPATWLNQERWKDEQGLVKAPMFTTADVDEVFKKR